MPVRMRPKVTEEVRPKRKHPTEMTRRELIAACLEDRLDPACSIRPVMERLLLKGFVGFENMSDRELLDEVLNRETLPGEERVPVPEEVLLPIE